MSQKSTYLPALDGLRGVSILIVLFSHAWLGHLIPGSLGLTIFFFISGFIVTRLMLLEWDENGRIDIGAFYLRRLCRLMPALLGFVVACLLVLELANSPYSLMDILAALFYFANYRSIFASFTPGVLQSPFVITWSLSVEEHYYLVFPFLFAFLARDMGRLLKVLACLLVVILAWRCWLVWGVGLDTMDPYRIYKATDTRLDSILYGAVVAILFHSWPQTKAWMLSPVAFGAGACLMLVSIVFLRDPAMKETLRYSVQGIALALMAGTLVFGVNPASRFLSTSFMVYVGRISYSLYLFHWLAFVVIDHYLAAYSWMVRFPLLIGSAFLLAHLSYHWLEPWGGRFRRRLPTATRYVLPATPRCQNSWNLYRC